MLLHHSPCSHRDSQCSCCYTTPPVHTLYGRLLTLHMMYVLLYPGNLDIIKYTKLTAVLFFLCFHPEKFSSCSTDTNLQSTTLRLRLGKIGNFIKNVSQKLLEKGFICKRLWLLEPTGSTLVSIYPPNLKIWNTYLTNCLTY